MKICIEMNNDLLNILGGNVSSEASDIVLGASCSSGGQVGICKTDDGSCLTNCTRNVGVIRDISCLEDNGTCIRDLILCPSDSCGLDGSCSWNCNNDCVTDGQQCTDNLVICSTLNACQSNCTSVGSEISTDAYLYTQFGKGTSGSALCTTKSRAVSLGLSVTGSYSDAQLVPKNKISIATASSMDIVLLVYLNNTSVVINTTIYSPNGNTSYLVPTSYASTYSRAKQYISEVGYNNIFNLYTNSSYLEPNYNLFWGSFRTDNSINNGGSYTIGQLNGSQQLGEFNATNISVNRTMGFSLELRMKNSSQQSEMAVLVDSSNSQASIRATAINLNITPYGVELPSSQSSNCEVSLSKTSYTLTNGKGYYSGNLYLNLLYF